MGKPRFNAASLKHKEDHTMLPEEIIIDERWNGRFEPHSEEDIIERAIDMVVNGQKQPCAIRKAMDENGKPQLVFGFLRAKAALYINQHIVPAGGVTIADDGTVSLGHKEGEGQTFYERKLPFPLWCAPMEGNALDSLKSNIIENLSRKATTTMDLASNQDRLLKENGEDFAEVAKLYKCSVERIKKNRTLLSLDRKWQLMIHRGLITADAGFNLLLVSDKEKDKMMEELLAEVEKAGDAPVFEHSEQNWLVHKPGEETNNPNFGRTGIRTGFPEISKLNGKKLGKTKSGKQRILVPSAKIKAKVREALEAKGRNGPARKLPEIMKFFGQFTGPEADPATPEPIKDLAESIMKFRHGDISDRQMMNAMYKLFDAKPAKVTA